VGSAAAIFGAVQGLLWLSEVLTTPPHEVSLVPHGTPEVSLDAADQWPSDGLVAGSVLRITGAVEVPNNAAIVANTLIFEDESKLVGKQVTVLASEI
jgi:hypothetical protein